MTCGARTDVRTRTRTNPLLRVLRNQWRNECFSRTCADSLPAWDSVQLAQYPVVGYASAVKGWLMHLREPLFPNALVGTLLGLDIGALACNRYEYSIITAYGNYERTLRFQAAPLYASTSVRLCD